MRNKTYLTQSAEETIAVGREIGRILPINSVVCFFGDLAAGKTTMIKGIVHGASGKDPDEINSPTFVYLNIYKEQKTIYHFDLYRLHEPDEFFAAGFHEFFHAGGICCIEWAERIHAHIPPHAFVIEIEHSELNIRKIRVKEWS